MEMVTIDGNSFEVEKKISAFSFISLPVYSVETTPVLVSVLFSRILICVTTLLHINSRHYTLKCVTDLGGSIHKF